MILYQRWIKRLNYWRTKLTNNDNEYSTYGGGFLYSTLCISLILYSNPYPFLDVE